MKELFGSIADEFRGFLASIQASLMGGRSHDYGSSFGKESSLISSREDGFSVTGDKQMSLVQSYNHLAVISPSGGGKTTTCILPTILRQTRSSQLINDNSKEIRERSAGYLRSVGYEVSYLDFDTEMFTSSTAFYNPLSRITSKADVAKLVSILVKQSSSESGNDKFWSISSAEVIGIAIERVLRFPDISTHHLASVYRYLQMMVAEEDRVSFDIAQFDDLFMRWKVVLGNSSNTRAGIFSSAIASLSWIDSNPNLALLTSKDTVSFSDMRSRKTALFLSVPLSYQEVYAPLLNCFYTQFYAHILSSELPKDSDLPILCLLDEFGSSMHIEGYPKLASVLRKWQVGNLMVLQTESQLEKYGKAGLKEILNSSTKVYFTGLDEEAERISRMLGKYSFKDEKEHVRERQLMTPDEVRTMPKDRCIIVPNGGLKPIFGKLKPYYEQRELVRRSKIKSEEEQGEAMSLELHLIQIDELPEELK